MFALRPLFVHKTVDSVIRGGFLEHYTHDLKKGFPKMWRASL
jgi:hypothetical protein